MQNLRRRNLLYLALILVSSYRRFYAILFLIVSAVLCIFYRLLFHSSNERSRATDLGRREKRKVPEPLATLL